MILINGKPINIGVIVFRTVDVQGIPVYGINTAYLEYVRQLGNVILIDAHDQHIHTELHAMVYPGGEDVEDMTGPIHSYYQQRSNPHATSFYKYMWQHYKHLPSLGICMGMQACAIYGSKSVITPHIELPTSNPRGQHLETLISWPEENPLYAFGGVSEWAVNSIHHQAFYPENIDTNVYKIIGVSEEFGNVEVLRSHDKKHLLVQFHPEELNCQTTLHLFKESIVKHYEVN